MSERFGALLKQARQRRGLTQVELGGNEYSASYISLLENGRREPTHAILTDFATRLNLEVAVLQSWLSEASAGEADLAAICLHAYQAWNEKDFPAAGLSAEQAAELAAKEANISMWWNMSFLFAESLFKVQEYARVQKLVEEPCSHALSAKSEQLTVKAKTFLSTVHRVRGRLPEALARAEEAVARTGALGESTIESLEARLALIAALAESRETDEAWKYAQLLIPALENSSLPARTRGQAA